MLEERLREIVRDRGILEGLKALIKELVEKFNPKSVIIAGSLAEGKFVRGLSDIDILVVVDKVSDEERFHLKAVEDVNVEITVVALDELREAIKGGNEFYRRSLRGIEIYGNLAEVLKRKLLEEEAYVN